MIIWLLYFFQNSKFIDSFIKGLQLAMIISIGIGLYQLYRLAIEDRLLGKGWYIVSSTFGHRNLFASLLLMALPFSFYAFRKYKTNWKLLGGLNFLLALSFILLLQARSAWLGLLASVLVFALLFWFKRKQIDPSKWVNRSTVSVLIVSSLFGFAYSWFNSANDLQGQELQFDIKVENTSDKTFTIHERGLMWKGTSRMIKDNSLLGVGPGNWKIHFPKYGSDIWRARQGKVQFQRPHNDYLWILAEQGIIGILSFLLFLLGIFYMGYKALAQQNLDRSDALLIRLMLATILGYMVVAFFSFPRERIFHQWILFGAAAIVMYHYFKNSESELRPKPVLIQVPLVLLAIVSLYIGLQRWKGEVLTQKLLTFKANAQWVNMKQVADQMADYDYYSMDPTSVPISFYEGLAELNLGRQHSALEAFERAYSIHPNNIHVVNNLATLNQLLNNSDEAIKYYEQALSISPKYLDGTLNLAAALFNNNEVGKAHRLLVDHQSDFPKEDERYKAYSLTILKVIQQNVAESIGDSLLSKAVTNINEEWLWQIHQKVSQDSTAVERKLIEDAIFGLDSLSHQISSEQAENFRNLYLAK